jgi:predicted MFS family arabinose efflux permease
MTVLGGQALGLTVLQAHYQRQDYRAGSAEPFGRSRTVGPAGIVPERMLPRYESIAWTVVAAAFIGLLANFSMHLINLRMQKLGIPASQISLSVALQAVGICVFALMAKSVIARAGLRPMLPFGAACSGLALIAIYQASEIHAINSLRVLFACGLVFLLIASEYLVTARGNEENRGRLVGLYAMALGAGTAVGPLLIGVFGIDESAPFLAGAAMFLLGTVPLSLSLRKDEGRNVRRSPPFAALRFMPVAFLAAFVFGMADNGGLSMLPVYAALNGYDAIGATNVAVFAALGAVLLQFPLGWIAAKHNPRLLLAICAVAAVLLLALLPFVIEQRFLTYAIAIGLGGVLEGLYTIALVCVSRERRVQSLSLLNACFISVCALGEVAGPLASGISMHYLGAHGLIVALVAVFGAYAFAMLNTRLFKDRYRTTSN